MPFEPDYDAISGIEEAKKDLKNWIGGAHDCMIEGASAVIDEMVNSFNVLFLPDSEGGQPLPEITIWPIGLDWPEITISLERLFSEFHATVRPEYDKEVVANFAAWLRRWADKIESEIPNAPDKARDAI